MAKQIRVIEVDGQDGLGKTTLLNNLKKYLESKGKQVYATRLLGGDGTDDFQLAIRKVLLHPKFPKNNDEFEEKLFSITCKEAVKGARQYLESVPFGFVLKDRGFASHAVYAAAKGMATGKIAEVHGELFYENRRMDREFGTLHLVLVAQETGFAIDRLKKRAQQDGIQIVERLENEDMQRKVMVGMRQWPNHVLAQDLEIRLLEVTEHDTILDVLGKATKIIEEYDLK